MGGDRSDVFRSRLAISFSVKQIGRLGRSRWGWLKAVVLVCALVTANGCSRLRPKPSAQYVYVTAKQTFLRDRVAAVSNRTGTVDNGDRLEVLEHGRRFVRVKTEKGETGWIDEKVVATQEIFDSFDGLKQEHKDDPAVASAVVRDDVYLHDKPGRDTDRLYRLPEGEKLKLLKRATLEKAPPAGTKRPRAAVAATVSATVPGKPAAGGVKGPASTEPAEPPPVMEDWWLVRDSKGRTGWIFSRMIDVDAPDTLTRYAEGQRFVGAYVLTRVNDPEAPQDDKNVPVFVAVLSPYKAGLPYDFDQVRVFTWNVKKHRYETAFREKNIEGYLPVEIKTSADPYAKPSPTSGPAPTFTYRVLSADSPAVVPDAATGAVTPGKTIVKTYRLEGNLVRRVQQPGTQAPAEAHVEPVAEKKKVAKGKKRR